jgi:hypothetical protein
VAFRAGRAARARFACAVFGPFARVAAFAFFAPFVLFAAFFAMSLFLSP